MEYTLLILFGGCPNPVDHIFFTPQSMIGLVKTLPTWQNFGYCKECFPKI